MLVNQPVWGDPLRFMQLPSPQMAVGLLVGVVTVTKIT